MKKEKIIEVRKKSSLPIIEPGGKKSYLNFKKGDLVSIKKIHFNFIEPSTIMTIVVSLIILTVGAFAFFVTWGEVTTNDALSLSGTECEAVTNPAIAQLVTIPADATITRVYETLNTGVTQDITSGDYSFTGTTVTITVTG